MEIKSVKSVFIRTTDYEKMSFTGVVSCVADRTRLSPLIIFKWKISPKNGIHFQNDVSFRAHPTCRMDENEFSDWFKNVCGKRKKAVFKKPSLLV